MCAVTVRPWSRKATVLNRLSLTLLLLIIKPWTPGSKPRDQITKSGKKALQAHCRHMKTDAFAFYEKIYFLLFLGRYCHLLAYRALGRSRC